MGGPYNCRSMNTWDRKQSQESQDKLRDNNRNESSSERERRRPEKLNTSENWVKERLTYVWKERWKEQQTEI